jgi:hypothetical protein
MSSEPPPASPAEGASPPSAGLHRLVADSLLVGLTPLVPLPLLDDWIHDLLRKRGAMAIAATAGVELTDPEARALGVGVDSWTTGGCLQGCAVAAVTKPFHFLFKLLFRKVIHRILFFLLVKDCVDAFSRAFHESYLLRHALEAGHLRGVTGAGARPVPLPTGVDPRVVAVRKAIEEACDGIDTRPVEKLARSAFAGSRRLLRGAGRAMARTLRRLRRRGSDEQTIYHNLERQGEAELGGLADRLTAAISGETAYLRRLEELYESRLAAGRGTTPGS